MSCTPIKLPNGGGGFICGPASPSSQPGPLPLPTALRYAEKLLAWLSPYCERLAIAGSIRRQRPACNDIDLLCIPKVTQHTDLLGAVVARDNHALQFLQDYVKERNPSSSLIRTPRFISGGETEGKQVLLELPKCQLDLWFADATTWATRLLCRTGSKEHNIWLAQRAAARDLHWNPYRGLRQLAAPEADSSYLPAPTEESLYNALGLSLILPPDREPAWLAKHIDSGL